MKLLFFIQILFGLALSQDGESLNNNQKGEKNVEVKIDPESEFADGFSGNELSSWEDIQKSTIENLEELEKIDPNERVKMIFEETHGDQINIFKRDKVSLLGMHNILAQGTGEVLDNLHVDGDSREYYLNFVNERDANAYMFWPTVKRDDQLSARMRVVFGDRVEKISDRQKIGMTAGYLELVQNEDEFAYVMAHELSHGNIKQKSMVKGYLGIEFKDKLEALTSGFSNKQLEEIYADLNALRRLIDGGYNPQAAINYRERVNKLSRRRTNFLAASISTHPPSEVRVMAMKAFLLHYTQEKRDISEQLAQPMKKLNPKIAKPRAVIKAKRIGKLTTIALAAIAGGSEYGPDLFRYVVDGSLGEDIGSGINRLSTLIPDTEGSGWEKLKVSVGEGIGYLADRPMKTLTGAITSLIAFITYVFDIHKYGIEKLEDRLFRNSDRLKAALRGMAQKSYELADILENMRKERLDTGKVSLKTKNYSIQKVISIYEQLKSYMIVSTLEELTLPAELEKEIARIRKEKTYIYPDGLWDELEVTDATPKKRKVKSGGYIDETQEQANLRETEHAVNRAKQQARERINREKSIIMPDGTEVSLVQTNATPQEITRANGTKYTETPEQANTRATQEAIEQAKADEMIRIEELKTVINKDGSVISLEVTNASPKRINVKENGYIWETQQQANERETKKAIDEAISKVTKKYNDQIFDSTKKQRKAARYIHLDQYYHNKSEQPQVKIQQQVLDSYKEMIADLYQECSKLSGDPKKACLMSILNHGNELSRKVTYAHSMGIKGKVLDETFNSDPLIDLIRSNDPVVTIYENAIAGLNEMGVDLYDYEGKAEDVFIHTRRSGSISDIEKFSGLSYYDLYDGSSIFAIKNKGYREEIERVKTIHEFPQMTIQKKIMTLRQIKALDTVEDNKLFVELYSQAAEEIGEYVRGSIEREGAEELFLHFSQESRFSNESPFQAAVRLMNFSPREVKYLNPSISREMKDYNSKLKVAHKKSRDSLIKGISSSSFDRKAELYHICSLIDEVPQLDGNSVTKPVKELWRRIRQELTIDSKFYLFLEEFPKEYEAHLKKNIKTLGDIRKELARTKLWRDKEKFKLSKEIREIFIEKESIKITSIDDALFIINNEVFWNDSVGKLTAAEKRYLGVDKIPEWIRFNPRHTLLVHKKIHSQLEAIGKLPIKFEDKLKYWEGLVEKGPSSISDEYILNLFESEQTTIDQKRKIYDIIDSKNMWNMKFQKLLAEFYIEDNNLISDILKSMDPNKRKMLIKKIIINVDNVVSQSSPYFKMILDDVSWTIKSTYAEAEMLYQAGEKATSYSQEFHASQPAKEVVGKKVIKRPGRKNKVVKKTKKVQYETAAEFARKSEMKIRGISGLVEETLSWSHQDQYLFIMYLRGRIEEEDLPSSLIGHFKNIGIERLRAGYRQTPVSARTAYFDSLISSKDGIIANSSRFGTNYYEKILNDLLQKVTPGRQSAAKEMIIAMTKAFEEGKLGIFKNSILSYLLSIDSDGMERPGMALKTILESFGTTGIKLGQLLYALNVFQGEEHEALEELLDKAGVPKRFDVYLDYAEELGVDAKKMVVGDLLGSASFKYALDYEGYVDKIIRKKAINFTPVEFKLLRLMGDILVTKYGEKYLPFKTLVKLSIASVERESVLSNEIQSSKKSGAVYDEVAKKYPDVKVETSVDSHKQKADGSNSDRFMSSSKIEGVSVKSKVGSSVSEIGFSEDYIADYFLQIENDLVWQDGPDNQVIHLDIDRHFGNSKFSRSGDKLVIGHFDFGQSTEITIGQRNKVVKLFALSQIFPHIGGESNWGIKQIQDILGIKLNRTQINNFKSFANELFSPKNAADIFQAGKSESEAAVNAYLFLISALDEAGVEIPSSDVDFITGVMKYKPMKNKCISCKIDPLATLESKVKVEAEGLILDLKSKNLSLFDKIMVKKHRMWVDYERIKSGLKENVTKKYKSLIEIVRECLKTGLPSH